ncbi:MAG TPA: amino acid permease [Candidatus Deferrimicrobium sp.]|nr:amino acid permease [Candidatus Deferrimicrobium sp.]
MSIKIEKRQLDLLRELGLLTAIACTIGAVIGSGIFRKPGLMATQLGSPELLVLVWIVAGVMSLLGALSIGEVAGMFPDAGGQYVYFNKSYNNFVGFLYGWACFAIIQSGSIASIAYVFSDSLGYFFTFPRLSPGLEAFAVHIPLLGDITPFKFFGLKMSTIGLLAFLTFINYLGVKFGGAVQVTFTMLKIVAIGVIVIFAFTMGHGNIANLTQSTPSVANTPYTSVFFLFIAAMAGAFWAYDGWINVTFIAGEIKNARRNVAKAMTIGLIISIVIYILINLAYIYVIPIETMAERYKAAEAAGQSYLVATDVAGSFGGNFGGSLIAVAIMISTFGAANGILMMSARVPFAMAREKLFFHRLGDVHPKFRTPGAALVAQGIWASILVLSGTFDQLTDMLIFVSWIFYAAAAYSVILLRKKMPDAPRPYRVWGYPYVPILFVVFSAIYVAFTLYNDISAFNNGQTPLINSVMGVLLVAIGIPGYLFWNKKIRSARGA